MFKYCFILALPARAGALRALAQHAWSYLSWAAPHHAWPCLAAPLPAMPQARQARPYHAQAQLSMPERSIPYRSPPFLGPAWPSMSCHSWIRRYSLMALRTAIRSLKQGMSRPGSSSTPPHCKPLMISWPKAQSLIPSWSVILPDEGSGIYFVCLSAITPR